MKLCKDCMSDDQEVTPLGHARIMSEIQRINNARLRKLLDLPSAAEARKAELKKHIASAQRAMEAAQTPKRIAYHERRIARMVGELLQLSIDE